jgi:hypothetical protein
MTRSRMGAVIARKFIKQMEMIRDQKEREELVLDPSILQDNKSSATLEDYSMIK